MNEWSYRAIIRGEKKYCDKFLEIFQEDCYNSYNKKTVSGDENNYQVNFEGDFEDGICIFSEGRLPVEKLTLEELNNIKTHNQEFKKYKLEDLTILFDLEIIIYALDDNFNDIYYHINRGETITDECPKELMMTYEEVFGNGEGTEYIEPEKMYGEDFYKYSDPEDRDGFC